MPPTRACDRDTAFCCMLVACKVIYYDYPRGEGRRLDGRCARGDSGRHLALQQAITLAAGGRLYTDARALVDVAARGRGAPGCCALVRAVMALEPGAVHAPGRTGLLHWLHAQCRARGRPRDVLEEEFCAELLFAGAAHLYLLFVHGEPVCDCGALAMCCYAASIRHAQPQARALSPGIVPATPACAEARRPQYSGPGIVPATRDHASTSAPAPACATRTPCTEARRHQYSGPGTPPSPAASPGIVSATPELPLSC